MAQDEDVIIYQRFKVRGRILRVGVRIEQELFSKSGTSL